MNIDAVRRRRRPTGPLLILALALAGCGSSGAQTTHTPSQPPATAARAAAASNGIPLPAAPARRIVSLSPAATEDLFAIGAGRQVVAADQYSTYPRDAPRTRLSGFAPNVEAIARYRPDLVVISQNAAHIESQLAALHIPVLDEPAPADLAGAYGQIGALGGASGHVAAATGEVARIRARVAAIVASLPHRSRPLSVYHELDQTHFSASSQTFIGRLYTLLGLRNIADAAARSTPYPQLSSEYIVARDPGLIVLADTVCCGQSASTVAGRPGWGRIRAVRDRAVIGVDDTVASEWGPRIVDFVATVAAAVRRIDATR